MANDKVQFITPVGRLVSGSVSKWNDKDADGKPYTIKTGPKAGQFTNKCYFALAIQKGAEQHWAQTEWGQKVWNVGHAAFPGIAQSPAFAWKIDDGDSTIPNTKGKKLSDNPNMRGHWILHISTQVAFKTCNKDGSAEVPAEQIKTGYYVQVALMVQGNGSSQKPGVYLNPQAVALSGIGEEIHSGINVAAAGFGAAALPAGAQAVPNLLAPAPAVVLPPVAAPLPNPAILAVPTTAAPIVAPPSLAPAAVPAVPSVPAIPAVPAPSQGPVMTPKAGGTPYASFVAAGWTDELLRQNGYIV